MNLPPFNHLKWKIVCNDYDYDNNYVSHKKLGIINVVHLKYLTILKFLKNFISDSLILHIAHLFLIIIVILNAQNVCNLIGQ